ncbi:hypothetical protein FE257_002845 [Aspergillus nanangensis]|uniref:Mediator of RNA polymerase II transcription subunit 4 n=1 Tax=Aspergillus nanangensis TaxID=2582783 RepID=A0AAD4GXS5_ASPNN|nr:hypothetical protein FE257_002845 [Aspergillus nanangensis]
MNTQFQSSLSTLESRFNSLLTSLTTSPTAAGAPAAALSLLEADDSLTTSIETLRQHQENYARIVRLRAEASSLEDQVKGIVREVVDYEKEIRTACGDDDWNSDSDLDDDDDDEPPVQDATTTATTALRNIKEVDYKLLLEFARRISKYNHQAAADATAPPASSAKDPDPDTEMTGTTTINGTDPEDAIEPVVNVTKDATSWLDESANMTRQAYMLPYPAEDRIRMGLMGQIQHAATEGRPDFNADTEVERLISEAEGCGVADGVSASNHLGEEARHAGEAAKAAAQAGSAAATNTASSGSAAKPMLDLDLYDPDDDD